MAVLDKAVYRSTIADRWTLPPVHDATRRKANH